MVRIASLLPAATEMVCALGLRDSLVGVSHECDWPADVVGLPVLTTTDVAFERTSRAIDRDVRALVRDALAVYAIDIEALRRARPDVILTQDLCDVCAVAYDDVCTAADQVLDGDVQIVNLRPQRLDDIWSDIARVAAALGVAAAGERVVASLRERVAAVAGRTQGLARPATLTVEWLDPVMIGGMWMPELVTLAGGRPLVTTAGQHAPTLDSDALRALSPAPEVVVIKPCGFRLAQTLAESSLVDELVASLAWPRERVYVADGNAYFNRPGPRIVESLELLAGCIHPDACGDLRARYRDECRVWPHPPQ